MMGVFYGSTSQRPVDEQAIKRQRAAGPLVHFKAMQMSWTSLALVGIDSHGKVGSKGLFRFWESRVERETLKFCRREDQKKTPAELHQKSVYPASWFQKWPDAFKKLISRAMFTSMSLGCSEDVCLYSSRFHRAIMMNNCQELTSTAKRNLCIQGQFAIECQMVDVACGLPGSISSATNAEIISKPLKTLAERVLLASPFSGICLTPF